MLETLLTIPEKINGLLFQNDKNTEIAQKLFGEDFLGRDAIRVLEEKCHKKGINVTFNLPKEQFPFDENQLKSEKNEGNRMVVLSPKSMIVNGKEKHITILTLRDLFNRYEVNPQDHTNIITHYDNNLAGEGYIFSTNRSYDSKKFAQKQLKPGYAVITKEFVPNSTNATWDEQQAILKPVETRTNAIETVWYSLVYYAAKGKKLLDTTKWNATNESINNNQIVIIGEAESTGLEIKYCSKWKTTPNIGMLTQLKL